MLRTELGQKIVESSYIQGDFLLRSGVRSSEYFDKYQFESEPGLLREIAFQLASCIPAGTEVLAGLELGGIPIATALSLETGLPVSFVRKERKNYGTCLLAEGVAVSGRRVCVIEDVITTGGQVAESTRELINEGAIIQGVLCVIFRGGNSNYIETAGWPVKSLFNMSELVVPLSAEASPQ